MGALPLSLRVGVAGFDYPDWRGPVYPSRFAKGESALSLLSRFIDLIEVNGTFYSPVAASAAERWVRRFRAAHPTWIVKVWKELTHPEHPEAWPELRAIQTWREVLSPLAESGGLAALLVQFPHRVRPGRWLRERILRIRELLDPPCPLAIELRHKSARDPSLLEWLRSEGLAFVNIDQPALPGCLPPTSFFTAEPAYVRLHGRNAAAWFAADAGRDARYDHRYRPEELAEWARNLESLQAHAATTLLVGNNHYQGKALAAVLELAAMLSGQPVPMPGQLVARYPDLAPLAAPPPGELF